MDCGLNDIAGNAYVVDAKCGGKAYGVFSTQKIQRLRAKDFVKFQLAMGELRNLLYSPGHDNVTILLDGIYYIGYTVYTGILPERWCGILTLKKDDTLKLQLGLNAKLLAAELKIFSLCGR